MDQEQPDSVVSRGHYPCAPLKLRQLIHELTAVGFLPGGGKGSHQNHRHPCGARITLGGKLGDDALPYQERAARMALREVLDESQ